MAIVVKCVCGKNLKVDEKHAGKKGRCPTCGAPIDIPASAVGSLEETPQPIDCQPTPAKAARMPPPQPAPPPAMPAKLGRVVEEQINAKTAALSRFLGDNQDPRHVEQILSRVEQLLMSDEEILYIAVQSKPVVNIAPDAVVLTNRRFIAYRPRMLGQVDFEDYVWRDLRDCKLKEGIMGATLSFQTMRGTTASVDYLPKAQARHLYRIAQEMEEKSLAERRSRQLEEQRAAAGGVVVQAAIPTVAQAPPQEDVMQTLKRLKEMADAGLITTAEFDAKKAEVLKRL